MTCRDVIDRVEGFAAGDQQPDGAARAHLETIPLGTVKTHLFRAKRQLRELMS